MCEPWGLCKFLEKPDSPGCPKAPVLIGGEHPDRKMEMGKGCWGTAAKQMPHPLATLGPFSVSRTLRVAAEVGSTLRGISQVPCPQGGFGNGLKAKLVI